MNVPSHARRGCGCIRIGLAPRLTSSRLPATSGTLLLSEYKIAASLPDAITSNCTLHTTCVHADPPPQRIRGHCEIACRPCLFCRYHNGGHVFQGTVLEMEVLPANWLASWSSNFTTILTSIKVRMPTSLLF